MNIILVGLPGSGKTYTGKLLAYKLKRKFIDLDREIEKETGLTIKEIFARYGESYFRRLEERKLQELFMVHNAVIATGGGTVERPGARKKLKNLGLVVYLQASPNVIAGRLNNLERRPLLSSGNPQEKLWELYAKRDKLYREVADLVVSNEGTNSTEMVNELIKTISIGGHRLPRKIFINVENSYSVYYGEKVALKAYEFIKDKVRGDKILIVSQTNIFNMYGKALQDSLRKNGFITDFYLLPQGEEAKSMEYILKLYDKALEFGVRRHDTVIAFGGGVVGDAAGFFAATFLRGINFIQIPTTLLAMVDSSVGGKVGINLPQGKNLVGAFYQPKMVFLDPSYLKSLGKREIMGGLAEAYKAFLIADEALARWILEIKPAKLRHRDWQRIILSAVKIKARIVSADEKEEGIRAVLNLGHTLGHALEGVYGFKEVYHGEAVAVGILGEAKLSYDLGILSLDDYLEVKRFISKNYSYLTFLKDINPQDLLSFMEKDKKNRQNISFVLLKAIGELPQNVELNREQLYLWLKSNNLKDFFKD